MGKKLTPAEAFEHLKAVFPDVIEIRLREGIAIVHRENHSVGFVDEPVNIDWGDATSYKPERWRPATIEDVKRALDEPIECRANGSSGYYLVGGYQCASGDLAGEVSKNGCTSRCSIKKIEVRE